MSRMAGEWIAYEHDVHPLNVAARFYKRFQRWPQLIIYPLSAETETTEDERKKLRMQEIQVVHSDRAKNVVLAGPIA